MRPHPPQRAPETRRFNCLEHRLQRLIYFGSVNQPANTPQPTAKTGDVVPVLKSSELTGNRHILGVGQHTDYSESYQAAIRSGQPQIRIQGTSKPTDIPRTIPASTNVPHNADNHNNKLFTQPFVPQSQPQRRDLNNSIGESQPVNGSHYPNNHNNRHYGPRPHYNHQGKHAASMGQSPGMQSPQAGYMPHHQKKPISPHMAPTSSPSMPSANIPWAGQMPGQYYMPQGYDGHPQFYTPHYPPVPMSPYTGMNVPSPGSRSSPNQPYVNPPQRSKAIPIINPETMTPVKAEDLKSSSSSSTVNSGKDSVKLEEKKERDFIRTSPSPSRAIKIVDPAIKEREEREQREKEETERKEKEEAERRAKEEEERKIREEAERKEREEKERLEAERKTREEKERLERKERERVEAEKRAQEEKERREREEREQKEREEKEREEAERQRLEQEQKEREKAAAREAEEIRKRELEEKIRKEEELREAALNVSKPVESQTAQPQSAPNRAARTPITMRTIDDPSTVQYPSHIKPPNAKNPETGKIQYDPMFLMQFQPLCLETTEDLSAFQNIGGDDHGDRGMRSGMQRRQTSERSRGPRTPASPMDMGSFKSRDGRSEMGKFTGGRPLMPPRNGSTHGLPPMGPPGSPGGMQREGSHGGRNRSSRGGGKGRHTPREQQGGPTIPLDQVVPLEKGENRWVPTALNSQSPVAIKDELIPQEVVIRKVKALLNKLTLEKFVSISAQIFEYAKQSEKEDNGKTLRTVMQLTFEKACDEPAFASMWAQLCRKMYDLMTDDIKDVNTKDAKGNQVSGIPLFRKYLFNRCQEEFERGWKSNLPKLEESGGEVMMTEEYYAAAKAKRQGLGLVQFIGELFKREMLTDRIMYECMKRLCESGAQVEDEEAESLCKLLTTIGKVMDKSPKTSSWIDAFFRRMKDEMLKSPNLSSRVKFMIQDVFDLRKNQWAPRRANQVGPTTIAQIHQEAQKAKNEEKESMKRAGSSRGQHLTNPMTRTGSHRGGRDLQRDGSSSGSPKTTIDGWSTVGTASAGGAVKGRATDMSHFGKADRSRTRSNILGPSNSPFASLTRAGGAKVGGDKPGVPSDGRSSPAPTMMNMFSALGGEGHDDSDKPIERKRLNLLPRRSTLPDDSKSQSTEAKSKMSDEAVERRAKNILDEYLSNRDKQELYECVKELDHPDYHVILITKLLGVIEGKAADVALVCETLPELHERELIEKTEFIKAFQGFMEGYEDLRFDVPQAHIYVAKLMVAAGVEPSEVLPEEIDETAVAQLKSEYAQIKSAL
ncbi:hypothetical protein DFQ28_011433 [Apophysomyces sp. BC1034]|nr:hypothetical protein DFQ29_009629 [Apophysomyces sp. BC1021]KAG0184294.1 hypothetical protein DFQ28_011433 [Apophysomyces sp. BC1034]